MNILRLLLAVVLLYAVHVTSSPAADTWHTCGNFVDSVPATITTQGVWCLRKDLATAQVSGAAISVGANNVTIDCNGYKIGGLAAGPNTQATGILSDGRQNITVRNCNVRGFATGIDLSNGAGFLVEDNRLDNNLADGIYVDGENSVIRRNRVYDTGGKSGIGFVNAISGSDTVVDNIVAGVLGSGGPSVATGIYLTGDGGLVARNHVTGLLPGSGKSAYGIYADASYQKLVENRIDSGIDATAGAGIDGYGTGYVTAICAGNTVSGFTTGIDTCDTGGGGNATH